MACFVSTDLGRLEARAIHDTEYPGIQIGLNRDDKWLEFAWVEVDQYGEKPVLKVHAYNAADDEPVYNGEETEESIAKFLDNN